MLHFGTLTRLILACCPIIRIIGQTPNKRIICFLSLIIVLKLSLKKLRTECERQENNKFKDKALNHRPFESSMISIVKNGISENSHIDLGKKADPYSLELNQCHSLRWCDRQCYSEGCELLGPSDLTSVKVFSLKFVKVVLFMNELKNLHSRTLR